MMADGAYPPPPRDLPQALRAVRAELAVAAGAWRMARPDALEAPAADARRSWRSRMRAPAGRRPSSGGGLIYAIGDVHGRLDLLQLLLDRVDADAAGRPCRLVFCGDYVDRGPASADVLEWLVGLTRILGPRVTLLKGNHEQALLRFLDDPSIGALWIERFGGAETLLSYGVPAPDAGAPGELAAARDELLANMPAGHLRLLQGLQLAFVHHDYLFTHAGLSPEARLSEQTEDDLLWGPDGFLEAKGPFEKFVVHGHTWRGDEPELLGHRIGLDTGAYATGVLTAVRIEDGDHRPLQALDEGAVERRAAEADARAPRLVQRPADYVSAPAAELGGLFARPTLHAADLG